MIVIDRNGRRTVVSGWRAWLLGAALLVGLTVLFLTLAVVLLGVAVTIGAVLLIAVPIAVLLALLARALGRR